MTAPPQAARSRGRPPARWALVAAYLAPLVTLPSGLWRFGLVFGGSMGVVRDGQPMAVGGWEIAYVIGLSVVAEAAALLTIGLVRPWGERAPAWMPLIGGRRVPRGPVAVVALLGALALMYLWVGAALAYARHELADEFEGSGWEALFVAAYAPLLLWGPLVAAVGFDFWRRRPAHRPARRAPVTDAGSIPSL
jgi:hypothetical protein